MYINAQNYEDSYYEQHVHHYFVNISSAFIWRTVIALAQFCSDGIPDCTVPKGDTEMLRCVYFTLIFLHFFHTAFSNL